MYIILNGQLITVFAGDKAAPPHRPHPNFDISKREKKKEKKKGKKKQTDKTK